MNLTALPAFSDNYIWLLHHENQALVVDPGDAAVTLAALANRGLTLKTILVTHHHSDHTGGVAQLVENTSAQVFGPAYETMPPAVAQSMHRLSGGDTFEALGIEWTCIDVPGHTAGHVAYFAQGVDCTLSALAPWAKAGKQPLLFCGDTLFSGGCGRLFEGTPAQMLSSLDALSALPTDTRVCCTHEYTLANLRFARAAEPDNRTLAAHEALCIQTRDQQQPTLPSTIGVERDINPFLRASQASLAGHLPPRASGQAIDSLAVFTHLREWKNNFK